MPVHDWTRVDDGIFHYFHLRWIGGICDQLNGGVLPEGYYAMGEQITGGPKPDVVTLQQPAPNGLPEIVGGLAVMERSPRVRVKQTFENEYVNLRNRVTVRHVSHHRVISVIEIVSHGNKSSGAAFREFVGKTTDMLAHGVQVLVIDLHPPTARDPEGLHAVLWHELTGQLSAPFPDLPLTLAAYTSGPVNAAYYEPTAVGAVLPEMPVFLNADHYVDLPLESSYMAAFAKVPTFYRDILQPAS